MQPCVFFVVKLLYLSSFNYGILEYPASSVIPLPSGVCWHTTLPSGCADLARLSVLCLKHLFLVLKSGIIKLFVFWLSLPYVPYWSTQGFQPNSNSPSVQLLMFCAELRHHVNPLWCPWALSAVLCMCSNKLFLFSRLTVAFLIPHLAPARWQLRVQKPSFSTMSHP